MKKIIACISLVFAMSAGVTALAADTATQGSNNSVDVNTDATYNTVLITDPNGKYVYVDQDDTTGFVAASNFLLKEGTDTNYGVYTVKMGSASGDSTSFNFEIVDPNAAPADIQMDEAYTYVRNESGEFDKGFILENRSLSKYTHLVFNITNNGENKKAMVELPFSISGESDVNFAVRVIHIPVGANVTLGVTAVAEAE